MISKCIIKPDVIELSEIKLLVSQSCNLILKGYNFLHNGSTTNCAGVGIFVKEHIPYKINLKLKMNLLHCEDL